MGVLCDTQIRELIPIKPFATAEKRPGRISFGVCPSYGYDIRVGNKFKIFTPTPHGPDHRRRPQRVQSRPVREVDCVKSRRAKATTSSSRPARYALCGDRRVDRDPATLVVCVGKSTHARCGLIVNVTPLEPEWRGKITLEISNVDAAAGEVYANEGIAQLIFLKADRCAMSYADKKAKYQDQMGLTLPKVD